MTPSLLDALAPLSLARKRDEYIDARRFLSCRYQVRDGLHSDTCHRLWAYAGLSVREAQEAELDRVAPT